MEAAAGEKQNCPKSTCCLSGCAHHHCVRLLKLQESSRAKNPPKSVIQGPAPTGVRTLGPLRGPLTARLPCGSRVPGPDRAHLQRPTLELVPSTLAPAVDETNPNSLHLRCMPCEVKSPRVWTACRLPSQDHCRLNPLPEPILPAGCRKRLALSVSDRPRRQEAPGQQGFVLPAGSARPGLPDG